MHISYQNPFLLFEAINIITYSDFTVLQNKLEVIF